MIRFLHIIFASLLLLSVLSCTPSAPYEIKSPCVAIEADDNHLIIPCIRRPVNFDRAIV